MLEWETRGLGENTTVGGGDLARTTDQDVEYLHAVVSNIEEAFDGGWDGSVYLRSQNGGQAWRERLLIKGISPRIAGAGSTVFVAFEGYECGGGAAVLRNTDHGKARSWSRVACVTKRQTLATEYAPSIAATDGTVAVAWIDERTGDATAAVSWDDGKSWTAHRLGRARGDESGIVGPVEVAADGTILAVVWFDRGDTVARVSVDSGRTWGTPETIARGGVASASAAGGLVAFMGSDSDQSSWIEVWSRSRGWSSFPVPATEGTSIRDQAMALGTDRSLGVASSVCNADRNAGETQSFISKDPGTTWIPQTPLSECATEPVMLRPPDGRILLLYYDDAGYTLAVGH